MLTTEKPLSQPSKLSSWLFNPPRFFAGWEAFFAGLVVLLLCALSALISGAHFDGVMDLHPGKTTFGRALLEILTDWLSLSILLLISSLILSPSKVRTVDIFGTQALARYPGILAALTGFFVPNEKLLAY